MSTFSPNRKDFSNIWKIARACQGNTHVNWQRTHWLIWSMAMNHSQGRSIKEQKTHNIKICSRQTQKLRESSGIDSSQNQEEIVGFLGGRNNSLKKTLTGRKEGRRKMYRWRDNVWASLGPGDNAWSDDVGQPRIGRSGAPRAPRNSAPC